MAETVKHAMPDAAMLALKAWEAWEAKLIIEGSDGLWDELGDLSELQELRNAALYPKEESL